MNRQPPIARYAPVTGRREWLASRSNGARLHAGVDLAAPAGTPVGAPENGVVHIVERDADATPRWRGYGPSIVLLHGESGAWHLLSHLAPDAELPTRGSLVSKGARLGTVGALAHVHWEVRTVPLRPGSMATVEVSLSPLDWLMGRVIQWSHGTHQCPSTPGNDSKTPRECRPAWRGRTVPPAPTLSPFSNATPGREYAAQPFRSA